MNCEPGYHPSLNPGLIWKALWRQDCPADSVRAAGLRGRTLPSKEELIIHQELQEFAKRSLSHDGSHFRGPRLFSSQVHPLTGVARGAGASGMGFWSMPIVRICD